MTGGTPSTGRPTPVADPRPAILSPFGMFEMTRGHPDDGENMPAPPPSATPFSVRAASLGTTDSLLSNELTLTVAAEHSNATQNDGPRVPPPPAHSVADGSPRCVACGAAHSRPSPYCSPRCRRRVKEQRQRDRRRVPRIATCATCSKTWQLEPKKKGLLPRYCSPACKPPRVRRRTDTPCEVCATSHNERPGNWRRWCSPSCRQIARERALSATERPPRRVALRKPPQRFCTACGGPFRPINRRHYFCSAVCQARDSWFRRPPAQRRAKSRRARAKPKETTP